MICSNTTRPRSLDCKKTLPCGLALATGFALTLANPALCQTVSIDPSAPVGSLFTLAVEWNWNTDGDTEGWSPNGDLSLDAGTPTGGIIKATSTGVDPMWMKGGPLNISPTDQVIVEYRIKKQIDDNTRMDLFWGDGNGGISGARVTTIQANQLPQDGEFHVVRIHYVGTIAPPLNEFRFDPISDVSGMVVELDYFKVFTASGSGNDVDTTGTTVTYTAPQNLLSLTWIGDGELNFTGTGVIGLDNNGGGFTNFIKMSGGLITLDSGVILQNGGWQGGVWSNNKASMDIAAGATLDLWDGRPVYVNGLSGAGNVSLLTPLNTGSRTLTVGVANGGGTFSGTLANGNSALAFTKTGSGYQILSGNNTHSGGTTISGGTLQVGDGGTNGSLGNGPVNIGSGAILNIDRSGTLAIPGAIGGAGILEKEGAGTLELYSSNNRSGPTEVYDGLLVIANAGVTGSGKITLNGGDLEFRKPLDGLIETILSGGANFDPYTPGSNVVSDLARLNSKDAAAFGSNNTTRAYTGEIYLTAGTWSFLENFDDATYLVINGQQILSDTTWFAPSAGSINIDADGWYSIDLRVGQGVGGVGAPNGLNIAVGIANSDTANSTDEALYTAFNKGTLGTDIRSTPSAITYGLGLIDVVQAATLDITDSALAVDLTGGGDGSGGLTKTGPGTLLASSPSARSGSTTISQGLLAAGNATALGSGAVSLNGGNLELRPQTAGLVETILPNDANFEPYTPAGRITSDLTRLHSQDSGAFGDFKTYAYSGQIYLTAGDWSFVERFDDSTWLVINGQQVLESYDWADPTNGTITIPADGWYSIDLRVGNGVGGVGGSFGWSYGVGVVKAATASTTEGDYVALVDGALGIQFRAGESAGTENEYPLANNLELTGSPAIAVTDSGMIITLAGQVTGGGALTKSGPGTLTLAQAPAHAGNTTVSTGTLALGSAGLADAATVSVVAGAVLHLGFSGTDTVGSLVLAGDVQPDGVYHVGNSGGLITGSGSLQVGTLVATPYETWATAKGLTGPAAAFAADPDNDGISNGLEFVLGGEPNPANPNAATTPALPTAQVLGDNLVFTYSRADAAAYLNPTVEFDADLMAPWTTAVDPANATIEVTDGTPADTVVVTIPKNGAPTLFARLKVVQPAP